jgi:hypothetical protein
MLLMWYLREELRENKLLQKTHSNGLSFMCTSERSHALCMSQKVVLQMLFLLERLVATFKAAFELTLVAFEMPIKFTLADKLAIKTDRALEL